MLVVAYMVVLVSLTIHSLLNRDVDIFIENLQHTLDFFENVGGGDEEGGNDDFVPFI